MKKFGWLICIFIFVFVTSFIVSVDTNTQRKKIQFSNQDFQINNEGNKISNNTSAKINLVGSNINNKQIKTNEVDINSSSSFNNRNVDFSNDYEYNNQNIRITDSELQNYKNLDDSDLDATLNDAKNYSSNATEAYNKPFKQMHTNNKYGYKNIDWSTWKSNFVNQILDDSLAIRELDNYSYGTLIYYSFIVDKTGRISNIQVKSINVSSEDKQKLARLIKSYEYGEMTTFPANTQRQTATVSAVMMLSNESQYSNPGDFNEFERVKFKL